MTALPPGSDPGPGPGQDLERLRVLAMLHYVVAGLVLAVSLLPLVFVAAGLAVMQAPVETASDQLPAWLAGAMFVVVGLALVLYGLVLAIALIISARCLRQHKHYWFSLVVGGGALLFAPLGTVLGVATLAVLLQESVRQLYGVAPSGKP